MAGSRRSLVLEFDRDLTVEIIVTQFGDRNDIVRLIRQYKKEPVSNISQALQVGGVIFTAYLLRERFFSGWKEVVSLIGDLAALDISYEICVNGELVDGEFPDRLESYISNIKRTDIY